VDGIKNVLKEIGYELDLSGSGYKLAVGSCKHGNEPSGSIKVGEFDSLSDSSLKLEGAVISDATITILIWYSGDPEFESRHRDRPS
jgi:hypothetical protein